MKIILILYSFLLVLALLGNLKTKNQAFSLFTIVLILIFASSSIVYNFYSGILVRLILVVILILLSITFIVERKKSNKEIHLIHHIIRALIHLIFIYFLLK